jgi:hypothetical protein
MPGILEELCMILDADALDAAQSYKLLIATIVLRAIG